MSEVGLENCPNPIHWLRGEGDVVLRHDALGVVYNVVICKDDGTPMYDQFIHAEPVGAVTVPVNTDGEIGLITVERPSFKPGVPQTFAELDFSTLGTPSLEVPRGFPLKGEASAQTARREADEELGSVIRRVTQIGELTPNTTFHPHRIPVYRAVVDHRFAGTMPPDVNEKILKVAWHSRDRVEEIIRSGEIRCAMTLGALMLHFTRG